MTDRTIWKFPLQTKLQQFIEIPRVYELLTVQAQDGVPTLWAIVNPAAKKEVVRVDMFPTGGSAPEHHDHAKHLGTVQIDGLVWHFFCPESL